MIPGVGAYVPCPFAIRGQAPVQTSIKSFYGKRT
ncbi:MAG: hypothetical protein JWR26_3393 [Pedosphaera sp.]|nr:hypothetical protein [Pedosphaera sp.]